MEVVQSFYLCAVPVAVDFSFLCYSMHCIGELRLSTKNFRDLKSDKDYRKNLKLVVDRHCELVNTHHFLEKIYGAPILYTSIDCAVATCMIVYQLFNVSGFTLKYLHVTLLMFEIDTAFQRHEYLENFLRAELWLFEDRRTFLLLLGWKQNGRGSRSTL